MTAYLTSVGVQSVSITIPNNATSNTATINAVSANAFILFDGFQAQSGANTALAYSRVELTNSTTVTAYRDTSSASNTATVKAVVVDANSNLIASVQSGTIVLGAGVASNTSTISAVNNSYAVVHYLGITSDQGSQLLTNIETILSLSGTTVTATRQATTPSVTVGFIVIEFQSAACNQAIQNFSTSWTNSSTSTTQAITSVNTNNALLIYAGSYANTASNEANGQQYANLTNGTTVTVQTNTAGSVACKYNFSVIEFAAGVLNSNVQRGTTALTGATSNTSTITGITTSNTLISWLHYISSTTTSNIQQCASTIALTNSTTVTATKNTSTGNVTVSWEVAEFVGTPPAAGNSNFFMFM